MATDVIADPRGFSRRRLLVVAGSANLGDGLRMALLPLFAVQMTTDPVTISALATVSGLPWLLGGVLSGPLVDRVRRPVLIQAANALRVVTAAALCLRWSSGALGLVDLFAAAAILGLAEVVVDNATQALVADEVPRRERTAIAGRLVAVQTAGNDLLGPAAAGVLRSWSPLTSLASLGALCLPGALWPLSRGGKPASPEEAQTPGAGRASARDAFRRLRPLVVLGVLYSLADSMVFAIFVLFVRDVLQQPEQVFGFLLAAGSLGTIAGSRWVERVSRPVQAVTVALLCAAVSFLGLALTSSVWIAGGAMILGGVSLGLWNATSLVLRQDVVPGRVFGVVNGTYQSIVTGVGTAGALAGGFLADAFSLRAPMVVGGAILAAASLLPVFLSGRLAAEDGAGTPEDTEVS